MTSILGFEPANVIASIQNAFASLMPRDSREQPPPSFAPAASVAGSGFQAPTVTLGGGFSPAPTGYNTGFQPAPGGYSTGFQPAGGGYNAGFQAAPGLGGAGFQAAPLLGGRSDFGDPYAYSDSVYRREQEKAAKAAAAKPTTTTSSPGGGNWAGPATADDNKGITAAKVEEVIAATRANSPMRGKGQLILDEANRLGVSVPEVMGIFLAESELGTTAGPTWNVAGLGGVGNFEGYNNIDDAIRAAIGNLATDQYRGKSLEEQIGTWFVGPQGWAQHGVNASDGVNGTVAQYIQGKVAPMYAAFGVPLNQTGTATKSLPKGGSGTVPTGATPWAGATGVVEVAQQWLGQPYVWGGASPSTSFDCSGLTQYAYKQMGVTLPRTAQQQYDSTQRIAGDQLQSGDLVFFTDTYETNEAVTHVGIFAGYDAGGHPIMLNAADGGTLYAPMDSAYWQAHLYGYGRVKK